MSVSKVLASLEEPGQVILSGMKSFTITLDSIDIGQLLDGLSDRAASWRRTADYLEGGESEGCVIEECSDAEEAAKIAQHFEELVESIRNQIEAQGGW
jgi:hypothetical protein